MSMFYGIGKKALLWIFLRTFLQLSFSLFYPLHMKINKVEFLIIWVYMYQFNSGNEVLLFHAGTCGLIFKSYLLCPEFQNLGHCYMDQTSNYYNIANLFGEFWRLPLLL